jgi:predicted nucleic acid-binding Zn ribbon protein
MPLFSNRDPKSIKLLIDMITKESGLDVKLLEASIPDIWIEVVGEMIGNHSKVLNTTNGKLFISTDSSTWKTEIFLRRQEIVDKINNRLGKPHIKELIVR